MESQYFVKITSIEKITHDVLHIITEKPAKYDFISGQATEVSIDSPDWKDEKRPFTFTCLPTDEFLEFTIKTYPSHKGVTNQLLFLKKGDTLILHEVFGAITYKGKGVFIAGGAGVTPFISILRFLKSTSEVEGCKLIFANKKKEDIILENEFKSLLGNNFISILSEEELEGYSFGHITESFLKENIGSLHQYFYVCGPPPMIEAIEKQLKHLKVEDKYIVKEIF